MLTRGDVEELLFREAALLDDWKLAEWLHMWADDGCYVVPALDVPDGDPRASLALIADDMAQLRARVDQLLDDTTRSEVPRSRTCHLVSNVHIVARDADRVIVRSAFAVHRARGERRDLFVGAYEHHLAAATLKIHLKKATLAHDHLGAQAKLSILL